MSGSTHAQPFPDRGVEVADAAHGDGYLVGRYDITDIDDSDDVNSGQVSSRKDVRARTACLRYERDPTKRRIARPDCFSAAERQHPAAHGVPLPPIVKEPPPIPPLAAPTAPLECHDCGQIQHLPALAPGMAAACLRCDAVLSRRRGRNPLRWALSLALTGLSVFLLALTMPMISVDIVGQQRIGTLFSGAEQLGSGELWPLGVLVAITLAVMPAARLAATLAVLLGLRLEQKPWWLAPLFGWERRIARWAMIEIFLLGVFVAYSRLTAIAAVAIGPGLYALGAFTLVMAGVDLLMDPQTVWQTIRPSLPPPPATGRPLIGCERCHLASPAAPGAPCPRCGAPLRARRPFSLQRCWALVIAGIILYLPANLYPVMTVESFGRGAPSTILSGAAELLRVGLWPLALLVFFASITVPVLKLLGLILLLISTHRGWTGRLRDRTRLYRVIEAVGRWSMIDVFMISILVSLVRAGAIASVQPDGGAAAFAAVVVLTMFAAIAFDPRLMWDAAASRDRTA